jgi:ATPase subunit of ABC transporter with duplicated ATPase domains
MITALDLELRAGARVLLEPTTLRVGAGDRIGLVGRNGAGKTTTLRTLAGESLPFAGSVRASGPIGYLPQDPRTGDLDVTAAERVLSARHLDRLRAEIEKAHVEMAERPHDEALVARYGRLEERFTTLGGYAAESAAARICANLGLPDRVVNQPAPSRRRCCWTSRPTISTRTRSGGCAPTWPGTRAASSSSATTWRCSTPW